MRSTETHLRGLPRKLVVAGTVIVFAVITTLPASAVSQRVQNACKKDYNRFCPGYALETPQLRACMQQVGKRLSPRCVDALVDAGEMNRPKKRP
jgi:predicted deacylase